MATKQSTFDIPRPFDRFRRLTIAALKAVIGFLSGRPVELILPCPQCGERHIDRGKWATKNHHTHACQHCGHVWRPAVEHTVGVMFLRGFKDEELEELS